MYHRFSLSGTYADSPTAVRCRWAFRDFYEAHVMLDALEVIRPIVESDVAAQHAAGRARG